MSRRSIEVDDTTYTFSPDRACPEGGYLWAIVRAQVRDEITAEPPQGAVTVETPTRNLLGRVAEDGLLGLVGRPDTVFSMLATQPYTVSMVIRARGYVPRTELVTMTVQAGFPTSFAPPNPGQLLLHREPVVLSGRVLTALSGAVVAGASVEITGIWRTPPPPTASPPASAPNIVSLHPPLYFGRPMAVGQLRQRNMNPVLGDDKQLSNAASAGSQLVRLSNRANLNPTDVLLVDATDPDRGEYVTIAGIAGGSNVSDPADIKLTHSLWSPHAAEAVVRRVVPQPPGTLNPFADEAIRGDTCTLLSSMANVGTAAVVEILGGPNPAEFHRVERFSTTTGPDGAYRLAPLSRVAQVQMHASDGVHNVTSVISADYTTEENRVDFVL